MHIWLLQTPGKSGAAACVSSELLLSVFTLKLEHQRLVCAGIFALLFWWFAALIISRWRDRHIPRFGPTRAVWG